MDVSTYTAHLEQFQYMSKCIGVYKKSLTVRPYTNAIFNRYKMIYYFFRSFCKIESPVSVCLHISWQKFQFYATLKFNKCRNQILNTEDI